jgi:hypothetical protein
MGAAFDSGQTAGMLTDGAATSANTDSPVFTSASYNFVAGDVNAYVCIPAGTNWNPGRYKIVSVAANAATLDAAIGHAPLLHGGLNQVSGCATVASPTGATWSIDYSLQDGPQFTYTDLSAGGAGSTFTSAGNPFGKQQVGNIIAVSSGTNVTVQRVCITSVAAGVATFDKAVTTGATSNGAGKLGGALLTDGQAGALHVASNTIWIKYNATAYAATSTTSNVAAGRFTGTSGTTAADTMLRGYDTVPGDETANRPTLQWGVNAASAARITGGTAVSIQNLIVDCNRANFTSTRGITIGSANGFIRRVKVMGASATAINVSTNNTQVIDFEVTDCTSTVAINATTALLTLIGGSVHDCATSGVQVTTGTLTMERVVIANLTGAGSTGVIATSTARIVADSVTIYATASHGWDLQAAPTLAVFTNCYVEGAGAYGFNISTFSDIVYLLSCGAYNNTSGSYPTANIGQGRVISFKTPTGSVFTNAAGNDFSLDNTASEGALLRAAGFPSSYGGLSTSTYDDVGAAQSQASGSSGGLLLNSGMVGGLRG